MHPPQLSEQAALPVLAGLWSAPHSSVTFAGHVIAGDVVSLTVMNWVQVALFPQASPAW